MKKALVNTAKIAISIAILAYLCWKGWQSLQENPEAFEKLVNEPKEWGPIGAALLVAFSGVILTFLRWRWLVRALGIPFAVRDALRLGFVGYLLNFALSAVGGDLFKVVSLAHRNPTRKVAAAATVVVDRIIGMYALFLVGTIATLFVDPSQITNETQRYQIGVICMAVRVISLISTIGLVILLLPGLATSPWWEVFGRIPKVGPGLMNMLEAVRMYRRQPLLLLGLIALSLISHSLFALTMYLIARGLPGPDPSLAANFIMMPLSLVASAAPLPGGVGAFEATFVFMYQAIAPDNVSAVQGLVIAVAYRAITLLVAAIGGVYYIVDRREVRELMAEAKEETVGNAA